MNRRGFLRGLVGGVAATAAVRTWPFRVYSFPTEVALPLPPQVYLPDMRIIYGAIQEQVNKLPVVMSLFDVAPPKWATGPIRFQSYSPLRAME